MKEQKNIKKEQKHNANKTKGITLIALVVTIVVLLILASVSITVVFGENGILQLAKEAGEKTNEAVQNDKENIGNMTNYIKSLSWDTTKVTAVTTKDGGIVPVPKGFVGSEADGENTIKDGFVIYEIPEGQNLDWQKDKDENGEEDGILDVQQDCNQFVWVPADGVSLEYKQDKETWSTKTYWYNECKDYWTDDEELDTRKASVAKYGGFYVGRYEAGVEESKDYINGEEYKANAESRNNTTGTPVSKKERQAWNYVNQTNAKTLSEKMYASSTSVTSRLIDSYAWDTICTWLSNSDIDVMDSTSWGNYLDVEAYRINGLYAYHTKEPGWKPATKYSKGSFEIPGGRTATDTVEKPRECYEIATGLSERNKAKNIYDFAGNMWEWTTETEVHTSEHTTIEYTKDTGTYAVLRGGRFSWYGYSYPAAHRDGDCRVGNYFFHIGFRPVLYLK